MPTENQQSQQRAVNSSSENPITHLDFQRMFPDEAACLLYLEKMRWPDGFVCDKCSEAGEPFRLSSRPKVLKYRACQQDASITAGTVMHRSKTSIHVWFWAAYLITAQTSGVSALELQKRLGIKRYETAFQLLHKLRAIMARPNRDKIGTEWPVELDIIFVGGKTRSGIQRKTNQVPVIIAVEIRHREFRSAKTHKLTTRTLAGRMRLQTLPNTTAVAIDQFVRDCIA